MKKDINGKLTFQTDLNDAWKPTEDELDQENSGARMAKYLSSNYIAVLSLLMQLIRPPFRGRKALLEFVPAEMEYI